MLDNIENGTDEVQFVLVFKLSRFGHNAADVLNSLQRMQDFGVNLICVEAVSYTHLELEEEKQNKEEKIA